MGIFSYYPNNASKEDPDLEKKIFRHSLLFPTAFIALFWLVKLIEILMHHSFMRGGIFPRDWHGLHGILLSPFIHSGFSHLISNSVPFFILLFTLVYFYRRFSYRIFWQIYFISGICVWLIGREAWHIGASGVVYGLAAFHFTSGVIRNDVRLLTLSVIVVFLYGSMVWGLLPINPDISWESHLWGSIAGLVMAFRYRNYQIIRKPYDWENDEEEDDDDAAGLGRREDETASTTHPAGFSGYHSSTTLGTVEGEDEKKQPEAGD